MFRLLSVSLPQALHNFLSHKPEEVLQLMGSHELAYNKILKHVVSIKMVSNNVSLKLDLNIWFTLKMHFVGLTFIII
jgi:hypothetical protein